MTFSGEVLGPQKKGSRSGRKTTISREKRERLGCAETVRQLKLRSQRCHPDKRGTVSQYLEDAEQRRGETVFDWLMDIIRKHGPEGEEERDRVELILD
jgi:hypothetical protein